MRKPEGVERDHVLGRPSVIINLAGRVPQPVPVSVGVVALGADEGVGPGAVGIGLEFEGFAVVVERCDDDRDHVVRPAHSRIALHVRRHDLLRIRVEADESHVQVLVVVHYTDFGGISGRCALNRLELEEIFGDIRLLPFGFVQMAVHLDGSINPSGLQHIVLGIQGPIVEGRLGYGKRNAERSRIRCPFDFPRHGHYGFRHVRFGRGPILGRLRPRDAWEEQQTGQDETSAAGFADGWEYWH